MKTVVKKWGINGEGLVFYDKKPVFVDGAIPGEVISFHVEEKRKSYCVGHLDKVFESSKNRRYPLCSLYKECGGCALMHVKYPAQAKMKQEILKETLKKYAGYTGRVLDLEKNEFSLGYRNACKLPVAYKKDHLVCGMYQKNSNDFVEIDRCFVHSKHIERAIKDVLEILNKYNCRSYSQKYHEGIRTLVIKEFNEKLQIILVTGKGRLEEPIVRELSQIEGLYSLWQSIKLDDGIDVFGKHMLHLGLERNIFIELEDLKLSLLPRSFFQLNTHQAIKMYHYVASLIKPCMRMVEAYSGIGAISLLCKEKAKEIIGIEYIQDAVDNANENARINKAENVSFVCGDAAKKLRAILVDKEVDTLVVDPPRTGLDDSMKSCILDSGINSVVYVSCNPSTLAKDLNVLMKMYRVESVKPFDLFSQTPLVETVVFLRKKR